MAGASWRWEKPRRRKCCASRRTKAPKATCPPDNAMPVFAYKAANTSGKTVEGKVEAGGRQDAVRMIEQQGLMPLRVTESSGGTGASKSSSPASVKAPGAKSFGFQSKKVSFSELEDFTRSLASLRAAPVPL